MPDPVLRVIVAAALTAVVTAVVLLSVIDWVTRGRWLAVAPAVVLGVAAAGVAYALAVVAIAWALR